MLQQFGQIWRFGAITPIIEPVGGHGANDVEELGGHYVMVQGKFEPSDSDATQVNDFRRVGIVKNPTVGGSAASISTARTTNALRISGTVGTNYQVDELSHKRLQATGSCDWWDQLIKLCFMFKKIFFIWT